MIFSLALRSLVNRRSTALLTVAAIAVSVALLLGVQKMRTAARESFANTVSGVDLIVGARSGQLNLLLYSVFRVGDATANVSWESYQKIARHPDVAWTIPISLGDSHRGFRVLGTTNDYFRHYHYAGERALVFTEGKPFAALYDVVLGADVARALGTVWTPGGRETAYLKSRIVMAARAAGKLPIGLTVGQVLERSFDEHKKPQFR